MHNKKRDASKGWAVLWKYLLGYRKELTTLSVLGVVSALANGSVPYVAGRFFDAIIKPSTVFAGTQYPMPLWVALLSVWGVLQMVAIAVDWMGDIKNEQLSIRIFADYKVAAFLKLLSFPLAFHKDRKMGEVMERINRAGNGFSMISNRLIIGLAPQFFSIVIGFGFAFYMNIQLASVLSLGVLFFLLILIRTVPQAVPLQRNAQKNWGKAYNIAHEAVTYVSMVKQFAAEVFQGLKIKNQFKRASELEIFMERIWSKISFSRRVIVLITQLSIFVLSVFAIQAGTMTLGELLAFNSYAAMVFGPFVVLGQNWQILQNGLITLERAEETISTQPEDYTPTDSVSLKEVRGAIEFKNVSFAYKKGSQVLYDVSFTASPGQVVALVGESGAGKSTLIDLISAYYFPAKGTITVDGVPTSKWNLRVLRGMIAIVPQEVALFNDTIEKNLAYGPKKYTDAAIKRAVKDAHADIFIEKFPKKYAQVVGERGVKLSVGQKQRIAIARAILRDPKILILDEPTSALDSETEKYVTDALDRVMAGRTTFVIAHRLSTVRRADKILVIDNGKIVESGTHDELMAIEGGNYRHRYELHVGLI